VQTIMPLPGHGAIRLTTARYYTPAGTSIQAKGIVPDIEVVQARVEAIDEGLSRREADLRNRLDNDRPAVDEAGKPEVSNVDGADSDEEDYQLARALDLLRGVAMFSGRTVQ
jgi:carboxyl-terminal processing protease